MPTIQVRPVRLFIDIDGTSAEFKKVSLETLYKQGYFYNLRPQQNVVDAVRLLKALLGDIEFYIISGVLSDSPYAEQEKNAWLNRFLPEIRQSHRIYVPCGENKADYVPNGVHKTDFLLDDYTVNLLDWQENGGTGIKLLNGINHTRRTWQNDMVSASISPNELAQQIINIICSVR